jgi:hypothetical protein
MQGIRMKGSRMSRGLFFITILLLWYDGYSIVNPLRKGRKNVGDSQSRMFNLIEEGFVNTMYSGNSLSYER